LIHFGCEEYHLAVSGCTYRNLKDMALSRRRAFQLTICGAAFGAAASARWWIKRLPSTAELSPSELRAMQVIAEDFMRRFGVPGLSVALSRDGALVYEETFGVATRESNEPFSTSSLFRIASVSKPITSVGIFTLVEKGKIGLQDRVFGPGAILGPEYGNRLDKPYISEICVDHLLTHTAGGWPNDSRDPMFQFPQLSQADLISWTLDNLPIEHPPGEHFAYSNFGYCVLGRIIERIAQVPYGEYIQQQVLRPCLIEGMRISGNTITERAPNEVTYYGQNGEDPYGMNVTRMDSHGGWLASAADLVRFANNIGGVGNRPGLLSQDSIASMTTPSPANPSSAEVKYARGWNVRNNGRGNWWHNGSLPGTTAILVRTATGYCWAALTNTRRQPSDDINLALDQMLWDMARQVRAWKP
jgi:CubicO group peptidase (beta-lactamase class C family)